jgi:hypothetical protein
MERRVDKKSREAVMANREQHRGRQSKKPKKAKAKSAHSSEGLIARIVEGERPGVSSKRHSRAV